MGAKPLSTNVDCFEYVYIDGVLILVAMVDYKHKGESLSTRHSAIQCQALIARKLALPFFFTITYLDPAEYDVPMYYVIPVNQMATSKITQIEGQWMTVRQYALWLHEIRGIRVPEKDVEIIDKLPNTFKRYQLPNTAGIELLL